MDAVERPLVVQQSFPEPRPTTNPYIVLLRQAIAGVEGVEVRTFSWPRVLFGRYDVLHLHWPENLVFGSTTIKAALRQLLTALLVARVVVFRIPVVRTRHNLELPEQLSRLQRSLLLSLERHTTVFIHLNPMTPVPGEAAAVVIPHGHYRTWFGRFPEPAVIRGRVGYVGLIRRYKQVQRLIEAFLETPSDLTLRVAGKPSDAGLAETVVGLASRDSRIRLDLRYVDEPDIVEVVGESELVVLPYSEMHNSGVVLTALSLERPVLVPRNELNTMLSHEVGPGWIHQFEGALTAAKLVETIDTVRRDPPRQPPDLSRRGWETAGAQHVAAYRLAIERAGRRAR